MKTALLLLAPAALPVSVAPRAAVSLAAPAVPGPAASDDEAPKPVDRFFTREASVMHEKILILDETGTPPDPEAYDAAGAEKLHALVERAAKAVRSDEGRRLLAALLAKGRP